MHLPARSRALIRSARPDGHDWPTGHDLRQLFIGSEGTLGVITRAVLRLRPLPVGRQTALCGLNSYDDAVRLLRAAQLDLPGLSAFEIMWESFFHLNEQALGLRHFSETYLFVDRSGRRRVGRRTRMSNSKFH